MEIAKKKDPETGKSVNDKTTVIYNDFITLENIILEAYDYIVNGKPALEWVMERQSVTTDKDSGIRHQDETELSVIRENTPPDGNQPSPG